MRQVKTETQHTRGKFIVIHAYTRKERCLINNLALYLRELKKEYPESKVSRGNNIRAEINEIEYLKNNKVN